MPGHIRFGDDDLPAVTDKPSKPTISPNSQENDQPRLDTESDEDAPEAVTQTSARDKIKSARQDATRAIEGQKAVQRQKRRSQADRLKEQAKASKRGPKRKRTATKEGDRDGEDLSTSRDHDMDEIPEVPDEEVAPKIPRKKALPDLLPDEILAVDPPARFPTPEPEDDKTSHKQPPRTAEVLEQRLAKAAKAPKDVKRGPVKVRVLEKKNRLLPPRANAQSRNLLDAMRHRHGALEQKAVKKGFATRLGG